MTRAVLALALVPACTRLLDLPSTTGIIDGDGDFVDDSVDNCPDVANPDQADADGDGIGDACASCRTGQDLDRDGIDDGCDACKLGRNDLDEDADGVADACDTCPAVADPTNADADGDGVGDACADPAAPSLRRRYFDGFDEDLPVWTSPRHWEVVAGHRVASDTPLALSPAVKVALASPDWRITARIVTPPGTGKGVRATIDLVAPTFATGCGLEYAAGMGGWHAAIDDQSGRSPADATMGAQAFGNGVPVRVVFHYGLVGNGKALRCEVYADDGSGLHDEVDEPIGATVSRTIALHADATSEVDYVDILAP